LSGGVRARFVVDADLTLAGLFGEVRVVVTPAFTGGRATGDVETVGSASPQLNVDWAMSDVIANSSPETIRTFMTRGPFGSSMRHRSMRIGPALCMGHAKRRR
jgi:hypothetical protein